MAEGCVQPARTLSGQWAAGDKEGGGGGLTNLVGCVMTRCLMLLQLGDCHRNPPFSVSGCLLTHVHQTSQHRAGPKARSDPGVSWSPS